MDIQTVKTIFTRTTAEALDLWWLQLATNQDDNQFYTGIGGIRFGEKHIDATDGWRIHRITPNKTGLEGIYIIDNDYKPLWLQ